MSLVMTTRRILLTKGLAALAIMLDGNMVVCPTKEGSLIVRVGKDGMEEALRAGATPMEMGGRTMSRFVLVTGDALEDDEALANWVARAVAFVRTLPAK